MTANPDAAERALHCLVEGCSIRSTERLTGLNRNTIMQLLLVAGERSAHTMDARMRNLQSRYLQVDEIWCYVGKKRRSVRKGDSPEVGDQWVYISPITIFAAFIENHSRDGSGPNRPHLEHPRTAF
ncbi:MAG TPA: hypothetical protein VFE08_09345 [Candidatus Sulfotelmatobacter sp.]|jgi:hypothetical protein|nr:hypothetical protein [Candidatus Sulfotelmatobacter sp.]